MKIVIHCSVGYVGMDSWDFYEVEDDITEAELDNLVNDCAFANAEGYGIYPYPDDGMVDAGDDTEYSDSIDGSWERYIPERHNKYSHNGTPKWYVT